MRSSGIPIVLIVVLVVALVIRRRPRRPETKASQPVPYQTSAPAPNTPLALSDGVRAELDRLVAADQKIQAIKVLRTAVPGLSLKDAKDRIDAWHTTRGIDLSKRAAGPAPTTAAESGFAPEALADVDRYIAEGKLIQAIKVAREQTGWGLREAKEWVDARNTGR